MMEENLVVLHKSSEQHKSIDKTRLKRDISDTTKIISRLNDISHLMRIHF